MGGAATMIWDAFMYRDEAAMLEVRLEAFDGLGVTHVLVEAPWTHRGVVKQLHFDTHLAGDDETNAAYLAELRLRHVVHAGTPDTNPWVNEHRQRNAAWPVIDAEAADDDWVLICDVDEIPSPALLAALAGPGQAPRHTLGPATWSGSPVMSVRMRTFLFAVDWEAAVPVPPTCVAAQVSYLRAVARVIGAGLAEVRDRRDNWPVYDGPGGWHFSWCGGPQAQAEKLATATCHTEILGTPEADLIWSGARWRSAENGGGLPVRPVDVDETWPAAVFEGRVPQNWFRPRKETHG
jgi:hypothetical protein